MANIYRVVVAVLVSTLFAFCGSVGATVSKTSTDVTTYNTVWNGSGLSKTIACSDALSKYKTYISTLPDQPQYPWISAGVGNQYNPDGCTFYNSGGGQGYYSFTSSTTSGQGCPGGSSEIGGLCYCGDGFKDSSTHTTCEADADKAKCGSQSGATDNNYTRSYASGSSSDVCPAVGGGSNCTVKITWDVTYSVNGVRGQSGVGKYTGSTCSSTTTDNARTAAAAVPPAPPSPIPAPGDTGAPAKNDCAAGSYPGTVNGVFRCVPPSGSEPVSTTGTTTTTAPTAPGATADTTSTKKDVTCTGNTCSTTTTTTTTPGSGGAATTTTATTQQPKEDFCTLNPKATQCISSSYGSGSCGSAPPSCSGDAIQCGIALQSWQTQCALNPTPGQEVEAYNSAKTITGSVTAALPGSGEVAIGSGSFDQSSHFAPVGLTDMQLQIAGKEFNVKFSLLNTWLDLLGNLGVAVTLLVAIRISLGGAV